MTARWAIFTLLLVLAAICLMAAAALMLPARARGIDHYAANHWYDAACCSRRDCEALAPEAVEDVAGGWRVRYRARLGFDVDVFVPVGRDRSSQDGRFHGCATTDRFLCLYVPRVA